MGLLIEGQWHDQWYDTEKTSGAFVRENSKFRHWVTTDGRPGPTGEEGFKAEPGRYHLYVSHACPWAHRTLIFRRLLQLEDVIDITPEIGRASCRKESTCRTRKTEVTSRQRLV